MVPMVTMLIPLALALLQEGDASAPLASELTVRARMPALLETGRSLGFTVDFALAQGCKVPANPLLPGTSAPAALLQIDVPAGAQLVGRELSSLPELLGSFFLNRPYEVLLEEGHNTVEFRLSGRPEAGSRFEFNVLLYVQPADAVGTKGARLVRQRFALPLRPGASSFLIEPSSSTWGRGEFLQLGDAADPFSLKTPYGAPAEIDGFLGRGPFVVVTYRSCL